MQPFKAFLFTFLLGAWEYSKKGTLHYNEPNNDAQKQYNIRAGRRLYEYGQLHKDTEGSITSLTSTDSIFSGMNDGNAGSVQGAFGNDFESSVGTTHMDDLKSATTSTISSSNLDANRERKSHSDSETMPNNPSITEEPVLVDIRDNNTVSRHNSASSAMTAGTHVSNDSRSTMGSYMDSTMGSYMGSTMSNNSANRQSGESFDTSYEDLESVREEGREGWKQAKEKARGEEILDEFTHNRRKGARGFNGHMNKYDMRNMDNDNYDVASEETLRKRIRELNSGEQGSFKGVIEDSNRSKKSRRTGQREREFSDYSFNYKFDKRDDDSNFRLNEDERLLRRIQEMNAEDRENMRKTLKRLKKNGKNTNLEDLENGKKSHLEGLQKYVDLDYDEGNFTSSNIYGSEFDDEDDTSVYVGKRKTEKNRSKGRTRNSMTELRSYIDETMNEDNAEIAHLLVNKIEKYKNKVCALKKRNIKEVNFISMKYNLKLKKILLSIPLISLITSVIVGLVLFQFFGLAVSTIFFITLFSSFLGTIVSYGIMGKIMFNSPFKVFDLMRGNNWKENDDYSSRRRNKLKY
ncbi:Plasmodium exported protein, unknown function [Plasmodium knowlesi strain H]|uniref:Pv-fam-d protein n=3 Tax=Plasmodium knowlesi TaxID=5850 RepID=A0A5K1U9W0_PLAKH|nr:Plasmodium exported protein, unknown function [Plasmodium knowlesi strain H]OTN68255.1 Uncharacterized protein PKNOH_S03315000 [Plasmodium knowlesi]CAA9987053.1 Plasmodium exported protein, unknown function [Plasmodium knowlesi strain H]SBO23769.1 Plasmodium exported protein, unknown function [Plasmodium knowlesi strain H]SBO25486.1 Plasmodium exported protein, unknown function [Plasmodium knowlesi strain H]VVS76527.1 Plasmodium exported protein, unknown function [Plasmodium knowlesi strain|eukprot:XP_002261676.1 hypothetical protein, conserved in Plasmodium species [Plasmodium knowlesi strain H]